MSHGPDSLPKLLVITAFAHNETSGGGALCNQLLKSYPPQRIYWWSFRSPSPSAGHLPAAQQFAYPIPPRLQPHRRFAQLKAWLVERTWVSSAARHLRETVSAIQPDAIWMLPWGWLTPVLESAAIHCESPCHVSVWDYADTGSLCAQMGDGRCQRYMRMLYDVVRRAHTFDAICHPMLEDLRHQTGRRDGRVVHSGVEPDQLEWIHRHEPPAPDVIRIAYAGTILVPRTFQMLVTALKALRSRWPRPVRVEFFGRNYQDEPWFDPAWMINHGLLDDPEFDEQLRGCTWGFLPMDMDDHDPRYNRFSLPNKLGTYLAAGLPILNLSHPDSSVAKLIQNCPMGRLGTDPAPRAVETFLADSLQIANPRQSFKHAILQGAHGEFNAAAMREELWTAWTQLWRRLPTIST